jgi:hypoxanthine phosphoribosyltransferase
MKNSAPTQLIKDSMIKYIGREEIHQIVEKLAKEIEKDYQNSELILIGPLKGSFLFLADLSRKIRLPQQIDFVQLGSAKDELSRDQIDRDNKKESSIKIIKDISVGIAGKHVLIVEEIIDSGRKLSFLKNRILAGGPASLKIVTLLDKPARRLINIKPDYVGRTIEDRYVVGYGMDEDGLGRNYGEIYYLKH